MSCPPTAQLLAKHTNRNGKNRQSCASKGEHDLRGPFCCDPVIGKVGQAVKHNVLVMISRTHSERRKHMPYLEEHVHHEPLVTLTPKGA